MATSLLVLPKFLLDDMHGIYEHILCPALLALLSQHTHQLLQRLFGLGIQLPSSFTTSVVSSRFQ